MGLFRRILVTTDFSEVANRSVRTACALAAQSGAELLLCHVIELQNRANPLYANYIAVEPLSHEATERLHERTLHMMEALVPPELGLKVELIVAEGPVADEIVRIAEERGVDLMVIATHGMGGLFERILGGVAARVLRHAHCPVLVTR